MANIWLFFLYMSFFFLVILQAGKGDILFMTQATQDMLDALREPNLGSAQVALIMSEVRKQLESRPEWDKKFPTLRFYCDWCMHSQIDRNKHCLTLIRELNQCLWQLDENGNFDPIRQMSNEKFMRLQELRNELGIVLTAISGDIVYPSQTFLFALFRYLKGIPVIPVDALDGTLARGKTAYNTLCQDLQIGPNRPLFKNLEITDVDDTCLLYKTEMDGTSTNLLGELHFPICSDLPFIYAAERQNEEKFAMLVNQVQQMFARKQLDDAPAVLGKALTLFPNIHGMDNMKAVMYKMLMEVEWARTGDLNALKYGEEAMKFIEDQVACSHIYSEMAEYAYQHRDQIKEALDVAKDYVEKSLELAPYDQFKAHPKHQEGLIWFAKKQYNDALAAYNEAARYAEEAHLEAEHAAIRCDLAELLAEQGYPEMALAEYTHAEDIANSAKNPILMASCAFRKARFLISIGDKETACQLIATMPQVI